MNLSADKKEDLHKIVILYIVIVAIVEMCFDLAELLALVLF